MCAIPNARPCGSPTPRPSTPASAGARGSSRSDTPTHAPGPLQGCTISASMITPGQSAISSFPGPLVRATSRPRADDVGRSRRHRSRPIDRCPDA
jgi:hypothetical protein